MFVVRGRGPQEDEGALVFASADGYKGPGRPPRLRLHPPPDSPGSPRCPPSGVSSSTSIPTSPLPSPPPPRRLQHLSEGVDPPPPRTFFRVYSTRRQHKMQRDCQNKRTSGILARPFLHAASSLILIFIFLSVLYHFLQRNLERRENLLNIYESDSYI